MNLFKKLLLLASSLLLIACQQQGHSADNEIKVGTMAGPDAQILAVVKDVAQKKYGLNIKIVEFTDYSLPNAALNDGSIDANIFQHLPYLDAAVKAKNYSLIAIGKTFVFPMGVYSKKIKNIQEIPNGAKIAIPNDPSNEARALLLLTKAGLITLNKNAGFEATPKDIDMNPKHLKFEELDAAQLPRTLEDVTAAVINSNFAVPAGLSPKHDAIYLENAHSPYANIIVVRTADKDNPKLKQLVESLHSKEVEQSADKIFSGEAIPGWK